MGLSLSYTRNPQKGNNSIKQHNYNISENDPELMDKPDFYPNSIARFHLAYQKAMLNERGRMTYSKGKYLTELQNRVKDETPHLSSFAKFLDFCAKIKK